MIGDVLRVIDVRLFQLARKHGAGGGRHTDAVEELKNAFELAERSSPGITNRCAAALVKFRILLRHREFFENTC